MVIPLMLTVVLGAAEFGVAFNNYSTLRQGAREGARQAVVADFGVDASCALSGVDPVTVAGRLMCLTKSRIGLDATLTRVKVSVPGGYTLGSRMVVCVQYPLDSITGLFDPVFDGRTLEAKVEMRIEEIDLDFTEAAETPPPGRDWSWCP